MSCETGQTMSRSSFDLSPHARTRCAQRNLSEDDLNLILENATEVEGGYLMRDKDVQGFDHAPKDVQARLQRLRGVRVVICEDVIITAYHAKSGKKRDLLRKSRKGGKGR